MNTMNYYFRSWVKTTSSQTVHLSLAQSTTVRPVSGIFHATGSDIKQILAGHIQGAKCTVYMYPLVMTNIAMVCWWPIEIDGLPINSMVIFHGYGRSSGANPSHQVSTWSVGPELGSLVQWIRYDPILILGTSLILQGSMVCSHLF